MKFDAGSEKTIAEPAGAAAGPVSDGPALQPTVIAPGAPATATVPSSGRPMAGGAELAPGQILGRCRIERELGRGGMGAVYLAHHLTLEVPVAVKVLPPHFAAKNPQFAARFLREGRLAARLAHPNLMAVRDADRDEQTGLHYLVLEFVDGGSVKDRIDAGPIAPAEALDIAIGVAEALVAAAEHRIVHRDIKPDNIMLTRKGQVKLADLGLAKDIGQEGGGGTMSEAMMGTPAYMSPEQIQDAKHVDARADLYSLGATLYHMLVGATPYQADSTVHLLMKVVHEPLPDPRVRRPELPSAAAELCLRLMAKKPEDRPASAVVALAEIRAARAKIGTAPPTLPAGAPLPATVVSAVPPVFAAPPAPPKRGALWLLAGFAGAGGILVFAAVAIVLLWFFLRVPEPPPTGPGSGSADPAGQSGSPSAVVAGAVVAVIPSGPASGERKTDRFGLTFVRVAAGDYGPRGVPGLAGTGVRISRSFWLGEREMPWSAYLQFDPAAQGRMPPGATPQDPVTNVSWDEAVRFCEWLTGRGEARYRLPTECEWEYAASAGGSGFDVSAARAGAVNPWNLIDLAGGPWEWCADSWEAAPTFASPIDPVNQGRSRLRVLRGGPDPTAKYGGGILARHRQEQAVRAPSIGLRLVQED